VVVDDSIVRGHHAPTLHHPHLSRLKPKKIIIVSTAPQIRYPDCYGIDMSELGKFVAFEAAVALLKERGQGDLLAEVYGLCRRELAQTDASMVNHVRCIYEPFTASEISAKIADLVLPRNIEWTGRSRSSIRPLKTCTRPCPITLATGISRANIRRPALSGGESGLRELFRENEGEVTE